MGEDSGKPDSTEARRMLDLCASVEARAVDLTLTNRDGGKEQFSRGVSLTDLTRTLPAMLDDATAKKWNVIVRPHGPGMTFLQLDDLDSAKLARLADLAFVTIQTSPGNYQAWLALPCAEDKEFVRRVKLHIDADMGASGATRIPGSFNFKPDHAPEKTGRPDYPRVAIHTAQPGRTVTAAELEQRGLVAPKEHFAPIAPARFEADHLRQWPDYQHALDRAKPRKDGKGPDLSGVDFVWCMTAATWGFSVNDTAEMLLQVSEHARMPANGPRYATKTATNAAGYVEQRRQNRQQRMSGHARG